VIAAIECQVSLLTSIVVLYAVASKLNYSYVDDMHFLYVNSIENSMRSCCHPIVYRNKHQMLINYNAIIVRTVERVNTFFFMAINLPEQFIHLRLTSHKSF
jgi:hypothetical protein